MTSTPDNTQPSPIVGDIAKLHTFDTWLASQSDGSALGKDTQERIFVNAIWRDYGEQAAAAAMQLMTNPALNNLPTVKALSTSIANSEKIRLNEHVL